MTITTLKDTTWHVMRGWSATEGYGNFSVDYRLWSQYDEYDCVSICIGYSLSSAIANDIQFNTATGGGIVLRPTQYFSLTFTGGTDVTNADLIAWLSANGELHEPITAKKFTRLYIGNTVASVGSKCFKRLTTEEPSANYLTFSSPNSFTLATYNTTKNWDGALEYSTDTRTWNTWDGTTTLSADDGVLYMRGTGNTVITGYSLDYKWVLSGADIACEGNIENLLDYVTAAKGEHPTMASDCYYGMFHECTGLTTAPELPATTLTDRCYYRMFSGCTSLIEAPELPATTLALWCYDRMFASCASLTIIPELPATTLTQSCYAYMFASCTSLTKAPELPATTLAASCYDGMFWQCTSLMTLPALPATTLAEGCYHFMFWQCANIKLSTTQTEDYQTEYRIPARDTGATAEDALQSMFSQTGGTFTGTPSINTTYYTSNTVV